MKVHRIAVVSKGKAVANLPLYRESHNSGSQKKDGIPAIYQIIFYFSKKIALYLTTSSA